MATFLGSPKVQYFKTGTVDYLVGGKLYSYDGGTLTPRYTYPTVADASASTNPNTNPVILDSRGEANVVVKGSTKLILKDSNDNIIWTVDNFAIGEIDIIDASGNELLKFTAVSDAVNEITITNAATSNPPIVSATGGDTNVGLKLTAKGSGQLILDAGATGTVEVGTTSTGAINLRRNTAITGTLTSSGTATLAGSGLAVTASSLTIPATASVSFVPAGVIMWKASTFVPTGWLECDGSAISRTTYSALFSDIGTTYGGGDGTTTFNLPNQSRRVIMGKGGSGTATIANTVGAAGGEETHTLITAEIPSHTHAYQSPPSATVFGVGGSNAATFPTSGLTTGATGGDGAHNNIQPSLIMMMIIRAY